MTIPGTWFVPKTAKLWWQIEKEKEKVAPKLFAPVHPPEPTTSWGSPGSVPWNLPWQAGEYEPTPSPPSPSFPKPGLTLRGQVMPEFREEVPGQIPTEPALPSFLKGITEMPWFESMVAPVARGVGKGMEYAHKYAIEPMGMMTAQPMIGKDVETQRLLGELARKVNALPKDKWGRPDPEQANALKQEYYARIQATGEAEAFAETYRELPWYVQAGFEFPTYWAGGAAFGATKAGQAVSAWESRVIAKLFGKVKGKIAWTEFKKSDWYKKYHGTEGIHPLQEREAFRAAQAWHAGRYTEAKNILNKLGEGTPKLRVTPPSRLPAPYEPELAKYRVPPEAPPVTRPEIPVTELPVIPGARLPAIPKAMPGMPEAGLQEAMLGVTPKEVYPKGKGVIRQAELDEYAKLEALKRAELGYTEQEVTEMAFELAGLEEYLKTDPIALFSGKIGTKTASLTDVLVGGQIPESVTPQQAAFLLQKSVQNVRIQQLGKYKGRVLKEDVLDNLATKFRMTDNEFEATLEKLYLSKQRAGELRGILQKAEVPTEFAPPEVKVPEAKVPIVNQLNQLYSEISTEVKAMQASVKGLTGDEAKIARETLGGLERELNFVDQTVRGFRFRKDLPEATKLRQTIHAWARYKGLSEPALREIYKSVSGRRQLRIIPQEQLVQILAKVKIARPIKVQGKTIVTAKTEKKIQSLKEALTTIGQMDEANFTRIMGELGIDTPRYVNQYHFITEKQGKELIRAINDDAEWIGRHIREAEALSKHPDIATQVKGIESRIDRKKVLEINGEPVVKVNWMLDARYYADEHQIKTGAPFGDAMDEMITKYHEVRYEATQYFDRLSESTPAFEMIARDEIALKRISNYIASKHKLGPKAPANITPEEITLAREIEGILFEFRGRARLAKFDEAYHLHPDDILRMKSEVVPDAPVEDLRKAVDIYESRGRDTLIEYLETRDWGIIKSGYEPLSVVSPQIHLRAARPQAFGKGHLRVRQGVTYPAQDRTILQRLNSYVKQMLGNTELSPAVRRFLRIFNDNAHLLKDASSAGGNFARTINEMKGYDDTGGPLARVLLRLYAQTMAAVFNQPHLWVRNLMIQNLGFHPDRHRFFLPSTHKPLNEQRLIHFKAFVSQKMGIQRDYLFRGLKPLPGLGRITAFANKVSRYPWTDEFNRIKSFQMRINKVDAALAKYEKDGDIDALIEGAGLLDLEALQQARALKLLARDTVEYNIPGLDSISGKEAFSRFVAEHTTNNVHFIYERALRSPAETGSVGRIMGNLFTFPRSYVQRIVLQGRKLRRGSGATFEEKKYATKTIIGMVVMGTLVGEGYRRITGKKYNPGSPINIISWSPGGLTIAAAGELSSTLYDLVLAATGDRDALGRVTTDLPRVARIEIPFYVWLIRTLETATDKRYIDRYALRKIREIIDKEYKPREEYYDIDRDFIEKIQHIFFGGATEKEAVVTPKKKPGELEFPPLDLGGGRKPIGPPEGYGRAEVPLSPEAGREEIAFPELNLK